MRCAFRDCLPSGTIGRAIDALAPFVSGNHASLSTADAASIRENGGYRAMVWPGAILAATSTNRTHIANPTINSKYNFFKN